MTAETARTVYLPDIELTVTIESPHVEPLPDESSQAAFTRARKLVTEQTFSLAVEAASIAAIEAGINHVSLAFEVKETRPS